MAVSTLVDLLGENFLKYMDAFKPYLYMGLKNHQEYQVGLQQQEKNRVSQDFTIFFFVHRFVVQPLVWPVTFVVDLKPKFCHTVTRS
jgi:hypothetical protein